MKKTRATAALGLVVATVLAVSCRDPTEIELEVRTNVVWHAGIDTSFTVGTPGQTEGAFSTTETREPWGADGFVGSLTVVPGAAKDASLSVKIVMGVGRDPHDCSIVQPQGCIFARRTLSYVPHRSLQLPIQLYAQCEGVPCDASTTCNFLGQCVSSAIDPSSCDSVQGCAPPDDKPTPDGGVPPGDDGGDASTDAPNDARNDGPPATIDGGGDAGSPGDVACSPQTCMGGASCCWNPTQLSGSCIGKGSPCTSQEKILECDGPEDCASSQCCSNTLGSHCFVSGGVACTVDNLLCHRDADCGGSPGSCVANAFDGAYGKCNGT